MSRPRIGISACLLGEEVRYDGTHRRSATIVAYFGDRVDWVAVCPEVEVGMGVPRETIELVATARGVQLLGTVSGTNHTAATGRWVGQRLEELDGICGYILKARSPSCGLRDVVVRGRAEKASGMFAAALVERFPDLPVVVDEDLRDERTLSDFERRIRDYLGR